MERRIPRASQPHLPTLAESIRASLAVANAGSFHLRWERGDVVIEQASFTGVDMAAVTNAVAAAPEHSAKLDLKAKIDALDPVLDVLLGTLLDYINEPRTDPLVAKTARTKADAKAAMKTKVDAL